MERRYSWETREAEFRYAAIARGFGTAEAMQAYLDKLAEAADPNESFSRRLRRIKAAQ